MVGVLHDIHLYKPTYAHMNTNAYKRHLHAYDKCYNVYWGTFNGENRPDRPVPDIQKKTAGFNITLTSPVSFERQVHAQPERADSNLAQETFIWCVTSFRSKFCHAVCVLS